MFSATSLGMSRISSAIGFLRYMDIAKKGSGGRALLLLQQGMFSDGRRGEQGWEWAKSHA